jgi:hypothetical protein
MKKKCIFVILSLLSYYLLFILIRGFLVGSNLMVGDVYDELKIYNFLTLVYILVLFSIVYRKK